MLYIYNQDRAVLYWGVELLCLTGSYYIWDMLEIPIFLPWDKF